MREGGSPFAQSECCPDMGGFVDGQGCIENKNCTDSCEKPIQMDGPKGCFLRKTEKPSVYFDGNANIERPCAPGTLFNEQACTCVQDVSVERSRPGAQAGMKCSCANATLRCDCSDAWPASKAGGIETRPYPISVGSCSRSSGFKGLMDDVNMYEDCVPDEMYGIFMSVLE
ncbi:hypothetical protein MAR_010325 [Mya arenaria]|uniref:Uncharacterized protein n=1 Tax=Mya arenaria TaxID=6604 RepID=A0ABY7E475_MYAAR|nr:hypothetical protein MAR_010325 [Mya arenaria]